TAIIDIEPVEIPFEIADDNRRQVADRRRQLSAPKRLLSPARTAVGPRQRRDIVDVGRDVDLLEIRGQAGKRGHFRPLPERNAVVHVESDREALIADDVNVVTDYPEASADIDEPVELGPAGRGPDRPLPNRLAVVEPVRADAAVVE